MTIRRHEGASNDRLLSFTVMLYLRILTRIDMTVLRAFPSNISTMDPRTVGRLIFPLGTALYSEFIINISRSDLSSDESGLSARGNLA